MDSINLKILDIIQQNGRTPNAEIARQVGLTPSAVLERLRKLEDEGVILGYVAKLDKQKLGYNLTAFIFVKSSDLPGATEKHLAEIPEVLEVHDVAGEDSYLVKVCAKDAKDIKRLVRREIGTLPDVVFTKTTIVLETTKETTALPLNLENSEKKK